MMEQLATHKWTKPALIGLVLLFSAALSLVVNETLMRLLAVGVLGLIGAVLLIRHMQLGLILLVITAVIVPFGIGTGTETSISAAMLLLAAMLGLWLLKTFIEEGSIKLVPSSTVLPILLLVLSAVISFIVGQLDWFPVRHASISAQLGGLMIFVFSAGAFLLAANVIKQVRWLELMTWVFLALCSFYLLAVLVRPIGIAVQHFIDSRAFGSVFWVWLFSIAFSQILFNARLMLPVRIALGGLLTAAGYVALFQNITWTSGWLPPLVAMFTIMIVSRSKLLYLTIAAGLIAAAFNYDQIYSILMIGDNVYSLDTRLTAWEILGKILEVNALFGLGPSNYYWYTPLFQIMGYYVPFNSHNNYVDIIAQTGILGLSFYLLFLWKTGVTGLNVLARVPDGFSKAYVFGAVGGLAGTVVAGMFGDWVIPFVYNIGFIGFRASLLGWLFLGGIVALEQIYPKKD